LRTTTPVVGVQLNAPPDTIQVGRIIYVTTETVFTANHLTDTDKQNSTGKYKTKYNSEKSNNAKYSKTKTTLVQSPLTTLGQETRWAYSTTPRAHTGQCQS